ncbi:MAG: heavy metal translocating P-type ATPase [Gemmatimonadota bacterium]
MNASALLRVAFGREARTEEDREARYHLRVTILVALALAVGAGLDWGPERLHVWRWIPFGIAYLVGGWRIALDGWEDLKRGRLNIDFLMGAAAVGAAVVGAPLEGVVLIFLFSLSKALEAYAMGRTRHALARLMDLSPAEATLVDDDGRETERVPVERLRPGDRILVRPGGRVAADGRVESGRTEIDQSAITGEAVPVRKTPGAEVYAGTINKGGSLVVEVTKPAGETMLARIVRLVEEAREERAPAQSFIDRFAHPYTLGVVAATGLAAVAPPLLWGEAWGEAFYRAMTLLVVASPCALVISTPSAILSGIANGARHGILFKGGAYLDLAGTIDTIAFDKTGTLTEGRPRLAEVLAGAELRAGTPTGGAAGYGSDDRSGASRADGRRAGGPAAALREDDVLRLAAAVERTSEHHLARAVVEAAESRALDVPDAEDFVSHPGEGVAGVVEGREVWVGNASMATRRRVRIGPLVRGWTAEQTSLGRSVVYVGVDDELEGAMSLGDALKPGVAASVRHLKYEGIRWITVLSGDHPDAVRAIAAEIGADEVKAGLLPDEKVEAVRRLVGMSRGVAMVGDGVNDAPAMATATLGVAMGAVGTDVAIETADVVLMSDDVEKVDYVIHLGKRARRVVRQNVYFSVGWMLLLVLLALTVGLPLPLAVVGHEGSTLLVAANGLRLLGGGPHPPTVPREVRQELGTRV